MKPIAIVADTERRGRHYLEEHSPPVDLYRGVSRTGKFRDGSDFVLIIEGDEERVRGMEFSRMEKANPGIDPALIQLVGERIR